MPKVSERTLIAAPAERVWKVVHEDLKNFPQWSPRLSRATSIEGTPGPGWVVAYEIALPGWRGEIEVTHDTWTPPRRCAGRFTGGPLDGTWSYAYQKRGQATAMSYDMDYRLTGMLRLLGGVLAGQYAAGIREQMSELKLYIESGRGPRR